VSLFLKQISKERNPTETKNSVELRESREYSALSRQTKTHSKEEIRFVQRKLTQSLKLGHRKVAKDPRSTLKEIHTNSCLDSTLLFLCGR